MHVDAMTIPQPLGRIGDLARRTALEGDAGGFRSEPRLATRDDAERDSAMRWGFLQPRSGEGASRTDRRAADSCTSMR
jgi:hypothetical protein